MDVSYLSDQQVLTLCGVATYLVVLTTALATAALYGALAKCQTSGHQRLSKYDSASAFLTAIAAGPPEPERDRMTAPTGRVAITDSRPHGMMLAS